MSQRGAFKGGGGGGGRNRRDRGSPYGSWRDRPGRNWAGKKAPENDSPGPQAKGRAAAEPLHTPESALGGGPPADGAEGSSAKKSEKKFSNKARLFVGNLPRDYTEDQLHALFSEHGEVQEVYVHKEKSFGFVRMVSGYLWCQGDSCETKLLLPMLGHYLILSVHHVLFLPLFPLTGLSD